MMKIGWQDSICAIFLLLYIIFYNVIIIVGDFMFTLIKNNDNNGVGIKNAQEKLYDYNTLFIDLMKNRGINKVNLTSIGNSIATGFSFNDSLVPLLKRNEDLINRCNFDLNLRGYARAQDNCDSKTFHYLNSNITQTEINAYVKNDY